MGKGKSDGDGLCKFCGAMTCCCVIFLLVLALLGYGIAKIVMGSVYIHDCPLEQMIPIYLIVSGLAPLLFGGCRRKEEGQETSLGSVVCSIVGLLFNIAWLICGSVWVYTHFGKLNDVDFTRCEGNVTTGCLDEICDKDLITFAFASITIDWVFMGLGIAGFAYGIRHLCCDSC